MAATETATPTKGVYSLFQDEKTVVVKPIRRKASIDQPEHGIFAVRDLKLGEIIITEKPYEVTHGVGDGSMNKVYRLLGQFVMASGLDHPSHGLYCFPKNLHIIKAMAPNLAASDSHCFALLLTYCRTQRLSDSKQRTVFAPKRSCFRHSCNANVVALDFGYLVAARPIEAWEELTISCYAHTADYLVPEQALPVQARRARMRARWGFDCTCSLCLHELASSGAKTDEPLLTRLSFCRELEVTELPNSPPRLCVTVRKDVGTIPKEEKTVFSVLSQESVALMDEVVAFSKTSKRLYLGAAAHEQLSKTRGVLKVEKEAEEGPLRTACNTMRECFLKSKGPSVRQQQNQVTEKVRKAAAEIESKGNGQVADWLWVVSAHCCASTSSIDSDIEAVFRSYTHVFRYLASRFAPLSTHKLASHIYFIEELSKSSSVEIVNRGLDILAHVDPYFERLHILFQTPMAALVAAKKSYADRCGLCWEPAAQKCSNCKRMGYCSKEHQSVHWTLHKNGCSPLEQVI